VGGFLLGKNPNIKAVIYGKSLAVKDCTEKRHQPPESIYVGSIIVRLVTNLAEIFSPEIILTQRKKMKNEK
jgi:hypothetical protein